MKLHVFGHRYHMKTHSRGFYEALQRRFELSVHFVEDAWPRRVGDIPELRSADACMWYVRFRELMTMPGFDWDGFEGVRLMYDEDAQQHFHRLGGRRYLGAWPSVFHRNGFDLLLCTGKQVAERLSYDGVPSHWIPKAFDPERLFDKGEPRSGICYFGALYRSRKAMLSYLNRRGVDVTIFSSQPDKLNDHLNEYLACVICNMEGVPKRGFNYINRIFPGVGLRLSNGIEPMLKNFEVAAAGCAPMVDWIPELHDLGFRDGENMLSYRSFEELVHKIRDVSSSDLRQIGTRAAQLAKSRHTWDQRALQIETVLCTS